MKKIKSNELEDFLSSNYNYEVSSDILEHLKSTLSEETWIIIEQTIKNIDLLTINFVLLSELTSKNAYKNKSHSIKLE